MSHNGSLEQTALDALSEATRRYIIRDSSDTATARAAYELGLRVGMYMQATGCSHFEAYDAVTALDALNPPPQSHRNSIIDSVFSDSPMLAAVKQQALRQAQYVPGKQIVVPLEYAPPKP